MAMMLRKAGLAAAGSTFLAALVCAAAVASPPARSPSSSSPPPAADDSSTVAYRYYAASIAAASAMLRLHDTAAARRWLDEAPATLRGWEWSYLDAEADRSAGVFAVHPAAIVDLSMSPDGELLATCGGTEVRLWDVQTGAPVGALAGHESTVWNVRFAADGKRLATLASDGTMRIWDRATGRETVGVEGVGDGVGGVAWHPDGGRVATGSWKRTEQRQVVGVVDVWDAATGERLHHFDHGVKPVVSVNFSPDGSRLYVGTWDFDVGVYDTAGWTPVLRLEPPDDGVYKAVRESRLSSDGALLAVAHDDGAVRLWDTRSGRLRHTLQRQAEGAQLAQNDVAWLAGGERIAAASTDLTVRLWDATGRHLAALHGHTSKVTALAASADGRALFSGDSAGQVRRWDLVELAPERHRWSLPDVAYGVAVSPGGDRVATTGWTGWAAIFDLESGGEKTRWSAHETSGVKTAWAPGDDLLATSGNDGRVRVWDSRVEPPALLFERSVGIQSSAVVFSSDGRFLASQAAGPALVVWSLPDGREVASLGAEVELDGAAWHPSESTLAVGGRDGVVRIWMPETDVVAARLGGHGDGPLQVAFSSDGEGLAAASASGVVRIWDLASTRLRHEMSVTTGGLTAIAFAPDDRRLATGGRDDSVHLWDPATGVQLLKLPFSASPWDLAWSRDGRSLLVTPLDGTLRVLRAGR